MKMLENQIAEMLDQLASKLGVASAKVWEWSLLQVKVEVTQTIILGIVAIIATVILAKLIITTYRKDKADLGEEEAFFGILIIYLIPLIAVTVLDISAVVMIYDLPKLLINPEYAAFQNIVEQLGKLK